MTRDRTSSSRNFVFVSGAVLMVAAVPLVFLALIFGSGGEMLAFVQSRTERMWIAALVAFPVLMFAAGASLLWASRGGRYGLAIAIALLMGVDIVAFAALTWIQNQPEPPVIVAPPDPHAVIGPTGGTVR